MKQSSSNLEQDKSNSGSADGMSIFADAMLEVGGIIPVKGKSRRIQRGHVRLQE